MRTVRALSAYLLLPCAAMLTPLLGAVYAPFAMAAGDSALAGRGAEQLRILLDADFDDKPLDQPIGTGGAAVGEPVSVANTLSAIVRADGDSNRLLEIKGEDMPTALSVAFQLLNDEEITRGTLSLSARVSIADDDFANASIGVRPPNTSASAFTNITFTRTGFINISDAAGSAAVIANAFQIGEVVDVLIVFDMDTRSYDVIINGEVRLANREHGITNRGPGRMHFSLGTSAKFRNGTLLVDDVLAAHVLADIVFANGFELPDE